MYTLNDLCKDVQRLADTKEQDAFYEECCRELAARFLRSVIKRTPVGAGQFEVKKGAKGKPMIQRVLGGGTLRRGWTAKSYEQAKMSNIPVMSAVNGIKVSKAGNSYKIVVTNVVPYASWVELGHRQQPGRFVPVLGKRLKNGWVEGQFMAKISMDELRAIAPGILRKNLRSWLRRRLP